MKFFPIAKPLFESAGAYLCPLTRSEVGRLSVRSKKVCAIGFGAVDDVLLFGRPIRGVARIGIVVNGAEASVLCLCFCFLKNIKTEALAL